MRLLPVHPFTGNISILPPPTNILSDLLSDCSFHCPDISGFISILSCYASPDQFMKMPATAVYRPTAPGVALSTPVKSPYSTATATAKSVQYGRISMPPQTAGSSVNSSAVPSLTSGSYAGSSSGERESSNGGAGSIDLIDMMTDRLNNVVNPIPLDRSLAQQAQT